MKKIFTLVFSLGILTSAFAQSGHNQQNKGKDSYQPSSYSGNSHDSKYGSDNYSNNRNQQWNNKGERDRHNDYAYNRSDHDRDEHFSPVYKKEQRGHDYDERYQPVKIPLIQIILGIGRR